MRALSALPLDDDIVDRIMTFCPSFEALQSTILVSKAFYCVFQTHPKSITRAVAYNIVGPALPQALRVVRYEYHDDDDLFRKAADLSPNELAEKCPEDHTPSIITAEEKRKLQENSKIVDELEDVYSFTQKDRTSRTSVLTPDESHRFRRAMYRIMLYTGIFRGDRYDIDQLEELSDEDIKHIQAQRTAVLSEFPTDELREIWAVVRFLRGVFEQTADGESTSESGISAFIRHLNTTAQPRSSSTSSSPPGLVAPWRLGTRAATRSSRTT
ncbi:hypothetical protein B0H16DRAFT_1317503 [Mycena metata]|uniref:F-box domain-containing protein n=1 Tax=Mycena metata TaxID=1033252 RepID=A0AAD7NB64_9AGAR|nr:hypothetical protein B0H16DRAFT_1317503 [Mycena metata]